MENPKEKSTRVLKNCDLFAIIYKNERYVYETSGNSCTYHHSNNCSSSIRNKLLCSSFY